MDLIYLHLTKEMIRHFAKAIHISYNTKRNMFGVGFWGGKYETNCGSLSALNFQGYIENRLHRATVKIQG